MVRDAQSTSEKPTFEPHHEKTGLYYMRTTKGQISLSEHPLISTFVDRCLNNIVAILAKSKISKLLLASLADQVGLSLTWLQTPQDRFSRAIAHFSSGWPGGFPSKIFHFCPSYFILF